MPKPSHPALRWFGLLAGLATLAPAAPLRADDNSGWEESSRHGDLVIYTRDHAGSSIKETRAIGTIDAPNWVVKNVLDDADHYASFMPYIVESRILSRDPAKRTLVAYARMTPPLIDPRDYTLLIHDEPSRAADGSIVYRTRWNPANDKGPAEKSGTVRVKVNEGSWLLEPIDGGQRTRGTYTLYTDGGGGIPAFIYNRLSTRRLTELFEVLNTQAKDAKYRQAKPAGP